MSTRKISQKVGDYQKIEAFRVPTLRACPCCGSAGEAWRYRDTEESSTVAICCSNGERFGPQDGEYNSGCLLYMPPSQFYQSRIKEAAEYWNEYAGSLDAIRRKNREEVQS